MPLPAQLSTQISQLPISLQAAALSFCSDLTAKLNSDQLNCFDNVEFLHAMLKVCVCSKFITESWLRQPELLPELINSGDLFSDHRRQAYASVLVALPIDSEASLSKQLRLFRRREMIRIAWRDLAGWSDLDETLQDLTCLAEVCIETAVNFFYQQACQRFGTPCLADGTPFNLVVLGMGKLGAWELNFSSDIDLIFAFAEEGELTGNKALSYGEFFSRICRSVVKALDEITVDGFVFRTDTRLRPFGDSGPLIMTFDGMEHYYLTQAREWERYAMIKARQVAGDVNTGKQLAAMIKPFVYRYYLDYGAFDALRDLKFQIMQELKRKDRLDNIKLGRGGIREIEFIGQAFQLIRGGKDVALQQREIQVVLTVLVELEMLSADDAAFLKFAYRFLRRLENHIQAYQDKQTHDLPTEPFQQEALAFSMDFNDWASLTLELDTIRSKVHSIFGQVFSLDSQDSKQQNAQLIWSARQDDDQVLEALAEYGCTAPDTIIEIINDFKTTHAIKNLTNKGLQVMQGLLPVLIAGLREVPQQDITLKRILTLFTAIAGRNVYLSLLAENPGALTQLIKLSSSSLWICELLAQYPMLFDELLYVRSLYEPLHKAELCQELQRELNKIAITDSEQLMIAFRRFKNTNVLRVAAADITGCIPLMTVSDYLTWIAEAIMEQVLIVAWQELGVKHGYPPGCTATPAHFAVLGFGKLGGFELGYASDLDLVFLCNIPDGNGNTNGEKPISSEVFYLRLARKICHILNTKMLAGQVYEVDLRLRPNGDSGLLYTHIDHYEDYLKNHAWTWEHQALVRARFITGDKHLHNRFDDIRTAILSLPRQSQDLKQQVREMREKMRDSLDTGPADTFNLKHGRGGMADIEFLVQFGVLAETAKNPALAANTGSIRLLESLAAQGFINLNDAEILINAYRTYRDYGHHQILQGQKASADGEMFKELRAEVWRIWQAFMEA